MGYFNVPTVDAIPYLGKLSTNWMQPNNAINSLIDQQIDTPIPLEHSSWISKVSSAFMSYDEFQCCKEEWQTLLKRSNADPLFMSWHWQFAWWQTWGELLGLDLKVFKFWHDDVLIGIIPMCLDKQSSFPGIKRPRLQFIGNRWRTTPTVRTEYVGPIFDADYESELYDYFINILADQPVWEITFADLHHKTLAKLLDAIQNNRKGAKFSAVTLATSVGVSVSTDSAYEAFLAKLSRNSRSKFFNCQKKLPKLDICFSNLKNTSTFLHTLNKFHKSRWGRPVFQGSAFTFHENFLASIALDSSLTPILSAMSQHDSAVSVSYNVQAGNTVYNIQSGYEESFGHGLSLGKAHLGHIIKSCFHSKDIMAFDLLAGSGKHMNFKKSLSGSEKNISTVALLRKNHVTWAILAWLYVKPKLKPIYIPLRQVLRRLTSNNK